MVGVTAALAAMLAGRWPRRGGIVAREAVVARLFFARGILGMAATAAAVTRGHVPSHQQQYNVPVRPPVVQVWYLKRYNYSPDGILANVQYGLERMERETYYQFPAALESGEFRSRNDMLHELFKASASVSRTGTSTEQSAHPCRPRMASCNAGLSLGTSLPRKIAILIAILIDV